MVENDDGYYARRAERQLDLARAASDPSIKKIHLELASEYATLRERLLLKRGGPNGSA